jgi:rod shape-determining protein MreC
LNFLNLNWRKLTLIIIAALLPLITINMEQKGREADWIQQPFRLVAGVAEDLFYGFSHGVKSTTGYYINLLNIKAQNQGLMSENAELKTRLDLFKELELENDRLRGLLQFKQKSKMELVAGAVVGRDLVPDHKTLTINKGTEDGIKVGQAVIALKGAVGTVIHAELKKSHVMLITDRYSVVDGIVQRTRALGIVEGKGTDNLALMKYIDRTTDLKKGDIIVTGGLDKVFPKGFPLAEVENVEDKAYSVAMKIELRPVIEPTEIEEVFVVLNSHGEDYTLTQAETEQNVR